MIEDAVDESPVIILSDRQAAALDAFLAGIRDARDGLPALADPLHARHRWDWLAGWKMAQTAIRTPK